MIVEKFDKIREWFLANAGEEVRVMNVNPRVDLFRQVQGLLTKPLPVEFIELYSKYNGEENIAAGTFLGHSLLSLEEMIPTLEFSKSLVKPAHRFVPDEEKAGAILKEIINQFAPNLPADNWYKFEFMCAPNTIGMAYLYKNNNPDDPDTEYLDRPEESEEKIYALAAELHELEKDAWNWDSLSFSVYADGTYDVRREDTDYNANSTFTSSPEGAIKLKYFNQNWLPIIWDYSGNYIAIDLDPDMKGTPGQVIIFGRDEDDMYVLAPTFEAFLDRTLTQISEAPEVFLQSKHLHEVYKEMGTGY